MKRWGEGDVLLGRWNNVLISTNPLIYFSQLFGKCSLITLRDVSYNARWFWTTTRYGPMTTVYLCGTTGYGL